MLLLVSSNPPGLPVQDHLELQEHLDVTDLGEPLDFLGTHIIRDRAAGTLAVHQIPCIQALIDT